VIVGVEAATDSAGVVATAKYIKDAKKILDCPGSCRPRVTAENIRAFPCSSAVKLNASFRFCKVEAESLRRVCPPGFGGLDPVKASQNTFKNRLHSILHLILYALLVARKAGRTACLRTDN